MTITEAKKDRFLTWLPGYGEILAIAVFLVVILLGPRLLNLDGDLGRHLTVGNYILDHHSIPTVDIFSNTMTGQPFTPHEWLAEVVYALANRLLGLDGVVLLCALLLSGTFWIVYNQAEIRSGSRIIAIIITLLAIVSSTLHWLARPHLFTFLLLAIWVGQMEKVYKGYFSTAWILPFIIALWVNLHGGFLIGFAVWAAYVAGASWDILRKFTKNQRIDWCNIRLLLLIGGVSLLATLINPVGTNLWKTLINFLTNSYLVSHTIEYNPASIINPTIWPFLIFIIFGLVMLDLRRVQQPAADWMLFIGLIGLGFNSMRNIPLAVIACAPMVTNTVTQWIRGLRKRKPAQAIENSINKNHHHSFIGYGMVIFAVIAGYLGGLKFDITHTGNQFSTTAFPVDAMDWVISNPQTGNVFNDFTWGGYILYRAWPSVKVFIDGQTDFYGEALTREFMTVITVSPGWQEILAKRKITWAVIPTDSELADLMKSTPGWRVLYQDTTAVVLRRDEPWVRAKINQP